MKTAMTFLAGVLFAIGLALSGMTNPTRIIAFLDVGGAWDPSLMLVMIGAIGVHATVFWLAKKRRASDVPAGPIDRRLIFGAGIFGIGWGLSGYCPGPGIVALVGGTTSAFVFVATMLAGIAIVGIADRSRGAPSSP